MTISHSKAAKRKKYKKKPYDISREELQKKMSEWIASGGKIKRLNVRTKSADIPEDYYNADDFLLED